MDLPMKEMTVTDNGDGTVNVEGEATLIDEIGNAVGSVEIVIPRSMFDKIGVVANLNDRRDEVK